MHYHGLAMLAITCLSACASTPPPTADEISAAYYGAQPSEQEVLDGIRNWMTDPSFGLENPASLDIRNLQLHKTYIRTSVGNIFGYLACFEWDARKAKGGYGGYKTAGYLIRDGQAWAFDHDDHRSVAATYRCSELRDAAAPATG